MIGERAMVRSAFAAIVFSGSIAAVHAQQSSSAFSGSVSLGVRSVELAGTEQKYREDVNLDDGLRVFDVRFDYRPDVGDSPVDDVTFSATSLGGDPYESIHLGVRKFGAYNLKLDRRRSDYFYEDTILPAVLASVSGSTGGDFHHFNFERVRDAASLELDLSPATRLSIGLERQTRIGESTTSLDIQRDEFELERPLDETLERIRLGVAHDWHRITLVFEEEFSDFENTSELFLPGASPGLNTTTNPAELQYFFLDQSYDYDGRSHLLRVIADPSDRIDVALLWRREAIDLDMQAAERALGTTFSGTPFSTDLSGPADVERDIETVGVDFGISVGRRARIIAGTRSSTMDQVGFSVIGPDQGIGDWSVDTDGLELGAEIALSEKVTVTAGLSSESRDVAFSQLLNGTGTSETKATDRDGYFLRVRYNQGGLRLQASIDDNSIDDPYSLAAPTDSRRYNLTARYAWQNGVAVQGGRRKTDVGNDVSGWLSDTTQTDLRLSYRRDRLELSAGASTTDIAREIDQLVTGGSIQLLFPIAYGSAIRFRDVWARWAATDRIGVGGSFGSYDNRGSYPLERDDHRIFVDFALTGDYSIVAAYRDVDYSEDLFDSYDADILELAFRVDW
jgi:hypothetical protein